eukprot:scaffold384647_cov60-Attheya_sp.AAC.1
MASVGSVAIGASLFLRFCLLDARFDLSVSTGTGCSSGRVGCVSPSELGHSPSELCFSCSPSEIGDDGVGSCPGVLFL